ncbi:unannotated protein [freshwater metagenome]|uniref:Unannotated protein n=1 Tax=freshwater metagenome TaxID=449393 RepID=A0A6J6RWY0_9ZZZZ
MRSVLRPARSSRPIGVPRGTPFRTHRCIRSSGCGIPAFMPSPGRTSASPIEPAANWRTCSAPRTPKASFRMSITSTHRTITATSGSARDIPRSRNRRCSVMQLPNSSVGELMSVILLSRRLPDSTFSLRSGRALMGLLLFVIRGKAVAMIVRVGTTGAPVVGMWMFGARSKERLLRRSNIQQSGPR